VRRWPFIWGLASAGLFLLGTALDWPPLWQGLLLGIPLMIATVGWGWAGGAMVIPVGVLLVWLGGETAV
jgi:hypothetical protein